MIAKCIDFIAHDQDMCLVHDLLEYGESTVKVKSYKDRLVFFLDEQGDLKKHVYVELMAQAIAVWAGYKRHLKEQPHCLGMLLGIRHYKLLSSSDDDSTLEISTEQVFVDGEIGAFDCSVQDSRGQVVAKARLTVYQPQDAEAFLEKFKEQK